MMLTNESDQLAALAHLHALLHRHDIRYWLFGGWAVDFYAGQVTRAHGDLDIAVWWDDHARIAALLAVDGWALVPESDEDGYTAYKQGTVRLEVTYLARDTDGHVYTPLREGQGDWPDAAFGDDVVELQGVQAQVIRLEALIADKSVVREDDSTAAKDRADVQTLARRA